MKTLNVRFEGICPLLQHDDKIANPFNPFAKRLKELTSKRKKTEDDLLAIARVDWEASLYYTKKDGYFIKAECFEATLLNAAKSKKLGNVFKQAVSIPDNPAFRFKDEKKTPEQLFQMDEYKDVRTVKVGTSKTTRCRPVFENWYCDVSIWYEETRLDESELLQVLEYAGRYIGVCDYRPKYGRFSVSII
jgi:hypothetical protein